MVVRCFYQIEDDSCCWLRHSDRFWLVSNALKYPSAWYFASDRSRSRVQWDQRLSPSFDRVLNCTLDASFKSVPDSAVRILPNCDVFRYLMLNFHSGNLNSCSNDALNSIKATVSLRALVATELRVFSGRLGKTSYRKVLCIFVLDIHRRIVLTLDTIPAKDV